MRYGRVLDTRRRVYAPDPIASHRLNDGLLAWWLCLPDLTGGRQFLDLRGLYHGTITTPINARWSSSTQPGGLGSLTLEGTSYVDIPNTVAGPLALTDNFTLACWFNVTTVVGLQGLIVRYHVSGDNSYFLRLNGTGLDFGGATSISSTGITLATNTWYSALATYGSGLPTNQAYIYVNGKQVASGTGVTPFQAGTSGVQLGNDYTAGSRSLQGQLNDCRIWGRAFSAADAYAWHNESLLGNPETLNRVPASASRIFLLSARPSGGPSGTFSLLTSISDDDD